MFINTVNIEIDVNNDTKTEDALTKPQKFQSCMVRHPM